MQHSISNWRTTRFDPSGITAYLLLVADAHCQHVVSIKYYE
jgi:hypothetical protein